MYRRHFIRSVLSAAALAATAQAAQAAEPTILVVGDSLSAEYGIARGTGWVALLEKKLAAEKIAAKVVNASISGDTTAGGRSRLPALLKTHQPAIVVIELVIVSPFGEVVRVHLRVLENSLPTLSSVSTPRPAKMAAAMPWTSCYSCCPMPNRPPSVRSMAPTPSRCRRSATAR